MRIDVRLLREQDDRRTFRSGNPDLDRFFLQYAGQNQFRHHIGSTYIAVEPDSKEILGYATVAPAHVDELPPALSKGLPQYPLPVLRLARLAVAEKATGRGVGRALLRFACHLAIGLSRDYGCVGILVDAKAAAETFYEEYGFYRIELTQGRSGSRPEPATMFLPLSAIEQALKNKRP